MGSISSVNFDDMGAINSVNFNPDMGAIHLVSFNGDMGELHLVIFFALSLTLKCFVIQIIYSNAEYKVITIYYN